MSNTIVVYRHDRTIVAGRRCCLAWRCTIYKDAQHGWRELDEMIKNRNLSSHTYNEEILEEIYKNIVNEFYPLFVTFQETMENLKAKEE